MILFFIRHGESTSNKKKVYQGWTDVHLSNKGNSQAKLLKDYFLNKKIYFDTIYSSPLKRAYETANHLSSCSKTSQIIVLDGMKSINVGKWAGIAIQTVKKKFPEQYRLWHTTPTKFRFPNGESIVDVLDRSKASLITVLNHHKTTDRIAIVSHMITIKVLTLWMLNKSLDLIWEKEFSVPNTGLIIFDVQKKDKNIDYTFKRIALKKPNPHFATKQTDDTLNDLPIV
ncbi:MAG: histidine phosphatase family protein [Candidatus Hodarchaeales archaeon]